MSNDPPGPFLFDPLPEPDEEPKKAPTPSDDTGADKRTGEPGPGPEQVTVRVDDSGTEAAAAATEAETSPVLPTSPGGSRRPQQILFEEPADDADEPDSQAPTGERRRDLGRVSPLARLTSGLLDLAAVLAVALTSLLGAQMLGIQPRLELLPGVVLFVTVFSFVYHVFPLLFWGRTPGMASADLVTRDPSGQTLTAWQATLRWAGSFGTVLLAGLPMIVSWFTGWSLADLVSGSKTEVEAG